MILFERAGWKAIEDDKATVRVKPISARRELESSAVDHLPDRVEQSGTQVIHP